MEEIRTIIKTYDFDTILYEYRYLIDMVIKRVRSELGDWKVDRDDLFQEGQIALHRAYEKYTGPKENFANYAYVSIRRRIIRHITYEFRHFATAEISSDRDIFTDSSIIYHRTAKTSDDPKNIFALKEKEKLLNRVYDSLDENQKRLIEYRHNGLSYKEMAEAMSVKPKKIDNEIQKIKRIIKRACHSYGS